MGRERKVLSVIFDRVEMGDDEEGLSFEEFQEFKEHLPMTYQLRMAKLGTWLEIAGDDGVLQFDEFQQLMDNFVDQVVGDFRDWNDKSGRNRTWSIWHSTADTNWPRPTMKRKFERDCTMSINALCVEWSVQ